MTTHQIGFDKSNRLIYMRDSRGRNTAALMEVDPESKSSRQLASDSQVDVGATICHPTEKHIQAVAFTYERTRWQVLDASIEPDFAYLRTVADGDYFIGARSLDDRYWIVHFVMDDSPIRYYLYDRQERSEAFLFSDRTQFENLPLAKMRPVVVKSRDGLDLVSYYTLPRDCDARADGVPAKPLPMVFIPHGGLEAGTVGDSMDCINGWQTARAVLSVNFRASTGFGKAFTNAGDREWGGRSSTTRSMRFGGQSTLVLQTLGELPYSWARLWRIFRSWPD